MAHYRKILAIIPLLSFTFLAQCDGTEDDGQSAENYPGQTEDEDAAFFAAPTEYGYSLQAIEGEDGSYLVLKYEDNEADVLRIRAESNEPVAFNYWNDFVYYGEMIGGSIEEGGVCSVKMFDRDTGESHVLCVVMTEAADELYGQVIAAAGLVFLAAETDHEEVKELVVSCFDIETGERLAEWTGVGTDIEFAGGCGTATPETVFFQIREGREYTLYNRDDRAFDDIHTGLNGRFSSDAGYWVFAKEVPLDSGLADKFNGIEGFEINSLLPGDSNENAERGFPVYYSYDLRLGEVNPLLLSRDVNESETNEILDGDPITVWIADGKSDTDVRIGFGAPLRASSMFILPCYPDPDEFDKYNRVKRIRAESSSGFYAEVEFPDELRFHEVPLVGEGDIPPEINWVAVSILEIYEGEGNGETCIAEISFDIR